MLDAGGDTEPGWARWEVGLLGILAAWMAWVRAIPADRFVTGGVVRYLGTDAYYHYRHALFAAANFPATLGYDLFTRYPVGTTPGPYGSLFDVTAAGVGLLLGGGPGGVALAGAYLPAILGAATVVPVYVYVRQGWGRVGGAVAGVVLALSPSLLLVRSVVGAFDHHVAEALLSVAFLALLVRGLARADVGDLDVAAVRADPSRLRPAVRAAAPAAVALWTYLWTWPPGLLFVAVATLGLLLAAFADHLRDRDPRDVQWVGGAALVGAGLLTMPIVRVVGLVATEPSLLLPVACIAGGLVVVACGETLARARKRGWPRWKAPAAWGVLLVLGLAVAAVLPGTREALGLAATWIAGLGTTERLTTIAEARGSSVAFLLSQFGLVGLLALAGAAVAVRDALADGRRAAWLFLPWMLVVFSAAWHQIRFTYYLTVVVAVASGIASAWLFQWVDLRSALDRLRRLEMPDGRTVAVALALVLVLAPGHVVPTEGFAPAWERADDVGPGGVTRWQEPLEWMAGATPAEPVDLTTPFERDGELPEGAYGVLAWWDYGHWITAIGQRIPVANPFQQEARFAADWLTHRSEAGAERMLEDREGTVRYVVIDDATASGKYGAIAAWADVPYADGRASFALPGAGIAELPTPGPAYNASMVARLYDRDATGLGHHRLVHEAPRYALIGSRVDLDADRILAFHRVLARMDPDEARQRYGSLSYDAGPGAEREADDLYRYDLHLESVVKVFERIEGAVLTGTTDPGAEVTATLQLRVETTGRAFTYRRTVQARDDGTFRLRVAYATSGPVAVQDGGTRYTVRAAGLYEVQDASGASDLVLVGDRQVLQGASIPVDLTG